MKAPAKLGLAALCIYGIASVMKISIAELGIRVAHGLTGLVDFVGPIIENIYNLIRSISF